MNLRFRQQQPISIDEVGNGQVDAETTYLYRSADEFAPRAHRPNG